MKTMLLVIFAALILATAYADAQDGFAIRPAADLGLAPGGVAAKNFPAIQTSVRATGKLDTKMLDFIAGIVGSGRISPQLKCRLQVQTIKEERKFSSGSQLVEVLQIELFTDHFGPRSLKYNFPVGSRLGKRIVNNQDVGPVEEIRVESPNPYENWFQFQHDGTRLVWAEMGSMYDFTPCLLKD